MNKKWIKYKIKNEYLLQKNYIRTSILGKETLWRTKCAGKQLLDLNQTNKLISDYIDSEKPFMVCRFGATEMRAIHSYLQLKHFPHKDTRKQCIDQLCQLSGFFPNDIAQGEKFVDLMLEDCSMIDLCATWNLYMEDYILDTYAPMSKLTFLSYLSPWGMRIAENAKLWTRSLKGKKVLVIHPFAETISYQYKHHRTKIFEKMYDPDDILPEFELIIIKAFQTLNCNIENIEFSNWFEALESMISQCQKTDFDIAIIGCGAYGFPLAASIKRMGKAAIHLGGAVQTLFGIMGKRWEKSDLAQIQNEYWTRPLPEEKPRNANEIEEGCYW